MDFMTGKSRIIPDLLSFNMYEHLQLNVRMPRFAGIQAESQACTEVFYMLICMHLR